jgi:hypothetical protein
VFNIKRDAEFVYINKEGRKNTGKFLRDITENLLGKGGGVGI